MPTASDDRCGTMSTMTTLTGPLVPTVVTAAVNLHHEVVTGNWAAAVDLLEDHFTDPDAARAGLLALAHQTTPDTEHERPQLHLTEQSVTFDADDGEVRTALDMYMRVLIGRFDALVWTLEADGRLPFACNQVRTEHQRPDAWPEHPAGSWSIAGTRAPREAKVAYDAWKLLGGGIQSRPLLTDEVTAS